MNVTLCPEQIVVPGLAVIVTDGATDAPTVMVILEDVAVVGETQVAFDVIVTVIISPLESDALV